MALIRRWVSPIYSAWITRARYTLVHFIVQASRCTVHSSTAELDMSSKVYDAPAIKSLTARGLHRCINSAHLAGGAPGTMKWLQRDRSWLDVIDVSRLPLTVQHLSQQ